MLITTTLIVTTLLVVCLASAPSFVSDFWFYRFLLIRELVLDYYGFCIALLQHSFNNSSPLDHRRSGIAKLKASHLLWQGREFFHMDWILARYPEGRSSLGSECGRIVQRAIGRLN